jgi:hypothetical protein
MYNWEHIDINLIDTIVEKLTKGNRKRFDKIMWTIKKVAVLLSILYLVYLFVVYGNFLEKVVALGLKSMFLGFGLVVPMSAIYICTALMIFHGVCYLIIPESIRKREG